VIVEDLINFIFKTNKLFQLSLKVFELGILGVEFLQALVNLLSPKPVVSLKAIKEFLDIILCSLN